MSPDLLDTRKLGGPYMRLFQSYLKVLHQLTSQIIISQLLISLFISDSHRAEMQMFVGKQIFNTRLLISHLFPRVSHLIRDV